MNLDELRSRIDNIDNEMCRLFAERMQVVTDIARYKKENNLAVYHPSRARTVLQNISKQLGRDLRIKLIAVYLIAGIIALIFEMGWLPKGVIENDMTNYILQIIGILGSLALIPVSLKGFHVSAKLMDDKPLEKRVKLYKLLSNLRISAFLLVIEYSMTLYYLIDDTVGLYCAAIGFICSLFCFPTNAQVSNDIQEDEED